MPTLFSFKSRNHTEFDELLAPHIESLYRLAYRFTGRKEDAEDLVQELLLRLFARMDRLREVRELKPWLARSLYNLYIDTIRGIKRSPLGHLDGDSDNVLALLEDQHAQPDNHLELSQQQKQLMQAVNSLGEAHRSLVIMHDMEGYTLNEMSQIMALPIGTLKSRLHRARNKLRESIPMEPADDKKRVTG